MLCSQGLGDRDVVRPSLEIHVPISPTPVFFNMVRCLVGSLRHYGGTYADAPVIVTVGADEVDMAITQRLPWIGEAGVEVRWAPRSIFQRDSYYATATERLCYDFQSDVVMLLDADTLVAAPFDDLVSEVYAGRYLAGLIAHASPFRERDHWPNLYEEFELGEVTRPHEHTGWGYMDTDPGRRFTPPYFNLGVICAPAEVVAAIGEHAYDFMHRISDVVDTPFRCQLTVSLAVTALGLGYRCLPMRYNFANDLRLEALHHGEMSDLRIVHLLRRSHQGMDKWEIYRDVDSLRSVTERVELRGVNGVARDIFSAILPDLEAVPTMSPAT